MVGQTATLTFKIRNFGPLFVQLAFLNGPDMGAHLLKILVTWLFLMVLNVRESWKALFIRQKPLIFPIIWHRDTAFALHFYCEQFQCRSSSRFFTNLKLSIKWILLSLNLFACLLNDKFLNFPMIKFYLWVDFNSYSTLENFILFAWLAQIVLNRRRRTCDVVENNIW